MSLSPHGASAVGVGNPGKAALIMLLGGVLGYISGQSWNGDRQLSDGFGTLMAFGTLVAVALPAQLIAGRQGRPLLLGITGMVGMTVPWFFDIAIEQQGQDVLLPALVIAVSSLAIITATAWLTRLALIRYDEG